MAQPAEPLATETPPSAAASGRFSRLRDVARFLATADPRTLGLYRISLGLLLLYDCARRLPSAPFFYSNDGPLPNHLVLERPFGTHWYSLYVGLSSGAEVQAAFVATFFVYLAFTLGFRTRLFHVLSLVCVTSMHARNILIENGGDVVVNLATAWSVFLPLGRRFSIDALVRSMRARTEGNPSDLADRDGIAPDVRPFTSLAVFALVLQLAVIYYFNAVHKGGHAWREGTAVYYALHQNRISTALGYFVREHAPLALIRALTWGTLLVEGAAPLLILSPWGRPSLRRVALAMLVPFHVGIASCMGLGSFQFAMLALLPMLVSRDDWEALERRARAAKGRARRVVYDEDCGLCLETCRVALRLDRYARLTFVGNGERPLPDGVTDELVERTVVVHDPATGRIYTRSAAVAEILDALPLGWVPAALLRLPGVRALADRGYDLVAKNRQRISLALGHEACGLTPKARASAAPPDEPVPLVRTPLVVLRELAVAVLLFVGLSQVLLENRAMQPFVKAIGPLSRLTTERPEWISAMVEYPRLFQGWMMFAPEPPKDDGTLVVDAVTSSGRHVDPFTGAAPRFELYPDNGYGMSQQLCDYFNRIRQERNERYRDGLRDWILRWGQGLAPAERLRSFDVYWIHAATAPPGAPKNATERTTLLSHVLPR